MDKTAIDEAHADLIRGLVASLKPANILEIGFGTGRSAEAILGAATYNANNPQYTLIDNWHDFRGSMDGAIDDLDDLETCYQARINVVTSEENDFVDACIKNGETFDFIFSDADHLNADKWFDETYALLSAPGILIYHDVTSPDFPNLKTIHDRAVARNLPHFLFNRESRQDERCSRGLLVIFKACG